MGSYEQRLFITVNVSVVHAFQGVPFLQAAGRQCALALGTAPRWRLLGNPGSQPGPPGGSLGVGTKVLSCRKQEGPHAWLRWRSMCYSHRLRHPEQAAPGTQAGARPIREVSGLPDPLGPPRLTPWLLSVVSTGPWASGRQAGHTPG